MKENFKESYVNWQKVMNEFEQSGLTQAKFCELHKHELRRFKYYRQCLKANPINGPKPAEFMAVKVQATGPKVVSPSTQPIAPYYKIGLPNGIKLELPVQYHKASLQGLLEVLCQC